jgi:hypothetical protein
VQQLDLDNLGRGFCKDKAQGINYKHAELLRKPGPQRHAHTLADFADYLA